MRSRKQHTISSRQVHQCVLERLTLASKMKDHGWLCTAATVWNVVFRAAAALISIHAACRDLPEGPCGQAILDALDAWLPKTLTVLEQRLNSALTDELPAHLKRRKWEIAIDWHLVPYYGEPLRSKNELYYGKPCQGTKHFHAYATACIVTYGCRYTLALTWVRRHESTVVALRRLIKQIRQLDVKIHYLLLDRAFFNVPVTEFLQYENLPFVMPVMFRGRAPKKTKNRPQTGLRWIQKQPAGWYSHTLKNKSREVTLRVCVTYRTHKNRKDGKRKQQKMLFAAWGVSGSPVQIRKLYRKRFGIETSYRQLHQAKVFTCTRNPLLRLVFIAVGLMLRNMWVLFHDTILSEGTGSSRTLKLEKLRFKQLLEWINQTVVDLFRCPETPYVAWSNS